ncbi:hypothetical protein F383_35893 [Gossypium arboreum]|uniref:Uncharacterized protein n=1 Tax=Gossypium arboreum TaxID=29729 RepID=A0A0B0N2K4_GOSAR|nr:hypothetical protein F383_35893 [Gossypium arboreum]
MFYTWVSIGERKERETGQKQRKWANVRNQHSLDFLTRVDTRPCQFGRVEARRETQACPCRAQVESNSEKANFKGF